MNAVLCYTPWWFHIIIQLDVIWCTWEGNSLNHTSLKWHIMCFTVRVTAPHWRDNRWHPVHTTKPHWTDNMCLTVCATAPHWRDNRWHTSPCNCTSWKRQLVTQPHLWSNNRWLKVLAAPHWCDNRWLITVLTTYQWNDLRWLALFLQFQLHLTEMTTGDSQSMQLHLIEKIYSPNCISPEWQ